MSNIADTKQEIIALAALVPNAFDTVDLTYTGTNPTTIVFSRLGNTVCTLTLTYDGSNNITKVVRS